MQNSKSFLKPDQYHQKECILHIVKINFDDSTTDLTISLKHHFPVLIETTCINYFHINTKVLG